MTTDPKNPLPPRLDPTCTCVCHNQPGIMHIAPCCRAPESLLDAVMNKPADGTWSEASVSDPRDAEIARYDLDLMESRMVKDQWGGEWVRYSDHADALAALSRRDAQMRAEGMREAADLCKPKKAKMSWGDRWTPSVKNPQSAAAQDARKQCYDAILRALAEKGD